MKHVCLGGSWPPGPLHTCKHAHIQMNVTKACMQSIQGNTYSKAHPPSHVVRMPPQSTGTQKQGCTRPAPGCRKGMPTHMVRMLSQSLGPPVSAHCDHHRCPGLRRIGLAAARTPLARQAAQRLPLWSVPNVHARVNICIVCVCVCVCVCRGRGAWRGMRASGPHRSKGCTASSRWPVFHHVASSSSMCTRSCVAAVQARSIPLRHAPR